ncbi:hypothetical protein RvY_06575 [Ramazzottius varieornatus]|uniref:ABC transporter domain-containing protein n=1 Tax=Ramazzottius varieornatus TaxID=947166 RepID=A0A1D1UZ25_RAMVA|nr:hypothetical protein RvY_06575 [Ramazzottius varieornatus]
MVAVPGLTVNVPAKRGPPTFFRQLWTMIRRNLLLKRRALKTTILEIFFPSLFLIQFIFFGFILKSQKSELPEIPEFASDPIKYPGVLFNSTPTFSIAYTPVTARTNQTMLFTSYAWSRARPGSLLIYIPFDSEQEMEKAYRTNSLSLKSSADLASTSNFSTVFAAGIVFNDAEMNTLDYKLRFPRLLMPATSPPYFRQDSRCLNKSPLTVNQTVGVPETNCTAMVYDIKGFIALQNVLYAGYTALKTNITMAQPLDFATKLMPQFTKTVVPGGTAITSMPASSIANVIGAFIIFLVVFIVTEKEKKHIVSMEVMGLRPGVYWISWSVLYFAIILVAALVSITIAQVLGIWPQSSFSLLFLDTALFGATVIALGWCVAPLFRRPLIAGLFAYVMMQIFGFLYLLETFLPGMTDGARYAMALLSPTALFMSLSRVSAAEGEGHGIGFGNAFAGKGFSFGAAMMMLILDLFLYGLLAAYLEMVFPSDDRPKQSPLFFLTPSYWTGSKHLFSTPQTPFELNADIEPVPVELRLKTAISTQHLRKVFHNGSKHTDAVRDFTYDIYEDEVLAILGHNGAGKTTLISMLTGMLSPTSGSATVYGNDITDPEQLKVAQTTIGICPQHDVLFNDFTVREHIEFYARLKGFSDKDARKEYERIVDNIGLRSQANVCADSLSGGQKRRLSIAVAIVGDPKVLILDEPTSGVDPYSRRFLWDLIREFKKGRCVILTTQSMQEADVFADRKLIFSHGRLRCAGTSLFLKNRFGLGYHLNMAVERDFKDREIEEFVQARISNAKVARVHGGEISFTLPKETSIEFPKLFTDLDLNLSELRVRSYGVSLTTMEEIFLKLAEDDIDADPKRSPNKFVDPKLAAPALTSRPAVHASLPKGRVPWHQKFLKLCKIRFLLFIRSKLALTFQFILPLILLLVNGIMSMLAQDYAIKLFSTDLLQIDELASAFRETETKIVSSNSSSNGNLISHLEDIYGEQLEYSNYSSLLNHAPHYLAYILPPKPNKESYTIAYNSSAIHSLAFGTNLLLNAMFRLVTGLDEKFRVASHAFPSATDSGKAQLDPGLEFYLVGFAMLLIPGIYGVDVCRDRALKIRSQIRTTGCPMWLYWTSAFFSHFVQYTLSFLLVVIMLYAFGIQSLTNAMGVIVLVYALHAPAIILFSYCVSFLFEKYETASVAMPFPIAMVGAVANLISLIATQFSANLPGLEAVHYIFAFLFPFYGFFGTMLMIFQVGIKNVMADYLGDPKTSYLGWDSKIPVILIAHAVHIPLLVLLLVYLESRHFNQKLKIFSNDTFDNDKKNTPLTLTGSLGDEDIRLETIRALSVNTRDASSYSLLLKHLGKKFDLYSPIKKAWTIATGKRHTLKPPKEAVRDISLVIPKGEIFGLLGPNGAGKTTTLSMVTGEVTPTSGDIYANGYHMHTDTLSAIESMGACPQTDTLWEEILMEEHFELFAALNGIPAEHSKEAISYFTKGLSITEHLSKKAANLSGGTKRKLTFVISMLGSPPLVLLDEPSTGMDPQSKRFLWDMIIQSFGGDRSAILTTHSMEEADSLCNRIGVIVNGTLQCVGSTQHLKDKYGSGYILEVKLGVAAMVASSELVTQRVLNEVLKLFPRAVCVEQFYSRMVFTVGTEQITSLGNVFADLDKLKVDLDLEEYSFSQTTIEQVFLRFAKLQESEMERAEFPAAERLIGSNGAQTTTVQTYAQSSM